MDKLLSILSIEDDKKLEELFSKARAERKKIFSKKIFTYGFVYFSNYCRNNCNFCYARKSNDIKRYRKNILEIIDIAKKLKESGVNLIDLTMGEDQSYCDGNLEIVNIMNRTKEETGLPVMISPGVVDKSIIDKLWENNAEWFALYQETHNKELFHKLRINQYYDERMKTKLYAKSKGLFLEEGIMVGIGESDMDIAHSIMEMGRIGADQMRVMSFVPQKGIPMENIKTPDRKKELKVIATLRIMYPDALIPASLDIDGIEGLKSRLDAGANVVTSIIPPKQGLIGVAQHEKNVDDGFRTVESVSKILESMNLRLGTNKEYDEYLKGRKND